MTGKSRGLLSRVCGYAAGLLFPPDIYCLCCGKYTGAGSVYSLCDHCVKAMNFQAGQPEIPGFDSGFTAMGYGVYERRLIFSLKYNGHTYVARVAAEILKDAMMQAVREKKGCPHLTADLITAVPVSRSRRADRGFDQAEKIAVRFAELCGMEYEKDVLIRNRDTVAQRGLSSAERQKNVEGAFSANPSKMLKITGKSILLIDDIYTTGATARECGRVLREAGAGNLYFAALLNAGNRNHRPPDEIGKDFLRLHKADKMVK